MENEKLNQIADKLGVDSKIVKKSNRRVFFRKLFYPFIQLGVLLLSFVTNYVPYTLLFGGWKPTYPFYSWDFIFVLLNPFHWGLHAGNLAFSLIKRKTFGLKKWQVFVISFSNFFLSMLGFFLIHKVTSISVSESLAGTGIGVAYNVYKKDTNIKFDKRK